MTDFWVNLPPGRIYTPPPGRATFFADKQSGGYGKPIPVVWGTRKVSGVILLTGPYKLASDNKAANTVTQIGICEGEAWGILRWWCGKDAPLYGTPSGWEFATGAIPQSAWSALTGALASYAIGYARTVVASVSTSRLDANYATPQFSFEVRGRGASYADTAVYAPDATTRTSTAVTPYDAHPCDVLYFTLTANSYNYGIGFDKAWLDGGAGGDNTTVWSTGQSGSAADSYRRFIEANGWYISPMFSEVRPLSEHLKEIIDATNSVPLWSGGVLKIIPLGDLAVTGNGVTYTPSVSSLYAFGAGSSGADYLVSGSGDMPVEVMRTSSTATVNCVPVEWCDRNVSGSDPSNAYQVSTVQIADPIDEQANGLKVGNQVSLQCITRPGHVSQIARVLSSRAVATRNTYRWSAGWTRCLLEPGDVVSLTDAGLGLSGTLVRIQKMTERADGTFAFEATDLVVGTSTAAVTFHQAGGGWLNGSPDSVQSDFIDFEETTTTAYLYAPSGMTFTEPIRWDWDTANANIQQGTLTVHIDSGIGTGTLTFHQSAQSGNAGTGKTSSWRVYYLLADSTGHIVPTIPT